MPTPNGAFLERPGYMNFTHMIRVRVVTRGEADRMTLPTQGFLKATSVSMGLGITTTLHTDEVQKLFRLHEAYWSGVHYDVHGLEVHGDGDIDTNPDDANDTSADTPEALSRAAWRLTLPTVIPVNTRTVTVDDPVDFVTGLRASQIMRQVWDEEDFCATQLELMQGLDLSLGIAPVLCYLEELLYDPVVA
jgi:hypothetical protein